MTEKKELYFASVDLITKAVYAEEQLMKQDEGYVNLNTTKYGVFKDALDEHKELLDVLCKAGIRLQNAICSEELSENTTKGRVRLTRTGDKLKISSYTVFGGNKVSVLLNYTITDQGLEGNGCESIRLEGTLLQIFLKILDVLLEAHIREVVAIYNLMVLNDLLTGLATTYKVKLVDRPKAEKHVIANIGRDFVELIADKDALLELQGSEIEKLCVESPVELARNVYNEINVLDFLRYIKSTVLAGYVKAVKKLGARKRVKLLSLIRKDFKEIDLENKHHFVYGYYKLEDDVVRLYTLSEKNIYVNTVAFELDTNDFVDVDSSMYQFDNGKLIKLR
jgi:hypothetical protein